MNSSWCSLFPQCRISHLLHAISDHCSIVLYTSYGICNIGTWQAKFEVAWLLEDSYEEEVRCLWDASTGDIPERLAYICKGLNMWYAKIRHEKGKLIKTLRTKLEKLITLPPLDPNLEELLNVKLSLNLESKKQEIYWEQCARANWLKVGNRNTAFFHCYASSKKRFNGIRRIEDSDGRLVEGDHSVCQVAKVYFVNLFSSNSSFELRDVLDEVNHYIMEDMNARFNRPFRVEEIGSALISKSF